jgi:hypothetical protein
MLTAAPLTAIGRKRETAPSERLPTEKQFTLQTLRIPQGGKVRTPGRSPDSFQNRIGRYFNQSQMNDQISNGILPLAGERALEKVTVLVVGSPALGRVVKHLFACGRDFEVVGSLRGLKSLERQADRLLPKLIVAEVKAVSAGVGATARAIKRRSPLSKLILLCPIREFGNSARRFGADACLDPEELIAQLIPTAAALSAGSGHTSNYPL